MIQNIVENWSTNALYTLQRGLLILYSHDSVKLVI